MADYLTLEQAAEKIGISTEELNRLCQKREIRAFSDSGQWKFRPNDVEAYAKARGSGSGILDGGLEESDEDSVHSDEAIDQESGDPTVIGVRAGGEEGDSSVHIELSEGSESILEGDESASGVELKSGSLAANADSDVLQFSDPSEVDSSQSLHFESDSKLPNVSDAETQFPLPDEEEPQGAEEAGESPDIVGEGEAPGATTEMEIPANLAEAEGEDLGQTMDIPVTNASSEEIPPGETQDLKELDFKLDDDMEGAFDVDDGDSDFDLAGLDDDESEAADMSVDSAPASKETGDAGDDIFADEVTAKGAESDINLSSPVDSGIDLESSDSKGDSEFELSLDSEAEADVFDTDDFEVDVKGFRDADEDDHLGVTEESSEEETGDSDFELEIDEDLESEEESGSDIVALDDDSEDSYPDDDEEFVDDDEEFVDDEGDSGEFLGPRGTQTASAAWPTWVSCLCIVNALLLVVGGTMLYEGMRHSWSHKGDHVIAAPLTEMVQGVSPFGGD